MAKKAFLLLALLFALRSGAQNPLSASFGGGYKCNFGTIGVFIMGVDLSDRIKYEIGPAINVIYGGVGATTGFKWEFVKARKYSVSFNADYQFLFNRNISRRFDGGRRVATFQTPNMHHVFAGASFNLMMKQFQKKLDRDKVSLNLCYGFPIGNYKATSTGNDYSTEPERKINNHAKAGVGFSITYTAYLFNN